MAPKFSGIVRGHKKLSMLTLRKGVTFDEKYEKITLPQRFVFDDVYFDASRHHVRMVHRHSNFRKEQNRFR